MVRKYAKRLVISAEEGGRNSLDDDSFISDIALKVYDAVIKKWIKELKEDPTPVKDSLSWNDDFNPNRPITLKQIKAYIDQFPIQVFYPEHLQLLEAKRTSKQSTAEYVIVDEESAEKIIEKDNYDNNVIILTDEGRTLYYVPMKFSGTIIIPKSVHKIKTSFSYGAIHDRVNLQEIIIEDGIEELEESCFKGCKNLTSITLPSTLRKIGSNVFAGCTSLTEVDLPEGLEILENTAFRACHKLNTVKLPSTLVEISMHINSYWNPIGNLYFFGMKTVIDGSRGGSWDRLVMHVLPGSEAENFAKKNHIRYVLIEKDNFPPYQSQSKNR